MSAAATSLPPRSQPHAPVRSSMIDLSSLHRRYALTAPESVDHSAILISQVEGTSMEPLMFDGDDLVIDTRPGQARPGDVVTVIMPDRPVPVVGILRDGDRGPWMEKLNSRNMELIDGWKVEGVVLLVVAAWDWSSDELTISEGPDGRYRASLGFVPEVHAR
jgi:hypothetical protein